MTTEKALLLRFGGQGYEYVEYDPKHLLGEFYRLCECESIETLPIEIDGLGFLLVVDEEGLLRAGKPNRFASFLAGTLILGNALVVRDGIRDGEPDIVGLSDRDIAFLKRLLP